MNTELENPVLRVDEIVVEDTVAVMPAEPPKKQQPKPKKKRFFKGLCLYFAILLVLCGGAWLGLYNMLNDYEAATPNGVLDQYVEWLNAKDYNAIYEAAGFEETLLNSKSAYLTYLARIYAGDPAEITLRERASVEENKKQFSVYFDNKRVSILDLTLVEADGKTHWTVAPQLVYQKDFVIYADPDARITVDGNDLSLLGITPKTASEQVFAGADDASVYPEVVSYTLSGLLNPPTVEALTLDGDSCTVLTDEKEPQVIRVMAMPDEETVAEQETFAKDAAFTYAKFIARDAGRNTLLGLIHKESALYAAIRNFSNAWFSKHESYSFEDVQLLNSLRYTEKDFTCEVQFQPYYVREGKTYKGEFVHYRMTFMLIDENWKMLSLTPVAENDTSSTTSTTETTTTTTATSVA